jgi:hypothetical protein
MRFLLGVTGRYPGRRFASAPNDDYLTTRLAQLAGSRLSQEVHARVADVIRTGKDAGLRHVPSAADAAEL